MPIYETADKFEDLTPSPGARLGGALGSGIGSGIQSGLQLLAKDRLEQMKHNRLRSLLGDLGGGPAEDGELSTQQLLILDQLAPGSAKIVQSAQKEKKASNEKVQDLIGALNRVNRQKEIKKTGHLGPILPRAGGTTRKTGSTFSKEGRKLRAEYERIGKSLISYATTIPIRNRLEFETLADSLHDPTLTNEEIEGNLDAMTRILKEGIKAAGGKIPSKDISNEEIVEDTVIMIDPAGVKRAVSKKDAREAQQEGYKLAR